LFALQNWLICCLENPLINSVIDDHQEQRDKDK